ncbi:N-acetyltransferase 6-like isoform X1 [Sesbania bispinosa]|nr:N-acetyltransferase 6-like isoform X1 [Sesbania bispinosa]
MKEKQSTFGGWEGGANMVNLPSAQAVDNFEGREWETAATCEASSGRRQLRGVDGGTTSAVEDDSREECSGRRPGECRDNGVC